MQENNKKRMPRDAIMKRNLRYKDKYLSYIGEGMTPAQALKAVAESTGKTLGNIRYILGTCLKVYQAELSHDRSAIREREQEVLSSYQSLLASGKTPYEAILETTERTGYKKTTVRAMLVRRGAHIPATTYRETLINRKRHARN